MPSQFGLCALARTAGCLKCSSGCLPLRFIAAWLYKVFESCFGELSHCTLCAAPAPPTLAPHLWCVQSEMREDAQQHQQSRLSSGELYLYGPGVRHTHIGRTAMLPHCHAAAMLPHCRTSTALPCCCGLLFTCVPPLLSLCVQVKMGPTFWNLHLGFWKLNGLYFRPLLSVPTDRLTGLPERDGFCEQYCGIPEIWVNEVHSHCKAVLGGTSRIHKRSSSFDDDCRDDFVPEPVRPIVHGSHSWGLRDTVEFWQIGTQGARRPGASSSRCRACFLYPPHGLHLLSFFFLAPHLLLFYLPCRRPAVRFRPPRALQHACRVSSEPRQLLTADLLSS